jgi:hypothetical protein
VRKSLLIAVAVALVAAPVAGGQAQEQPRLTKERATAIFLAEPKVDSWLGRYPEEGRVTDATYEPSRRAWETGVWSGEAGQIAKGLVDDGSGTVTEAWTGPQVAWTMARGYKGAFGGDELERLPVWLGFCALFLIGLADLRRPLSVRNLDLLVLISFSISLWYFNDGHVFASMSLVYPPLLYLLARMVWVGFRGRAGPASRPVWPVWVLAAATVFLAGFRVGLNLVAEQGEESTRVIDVGYAGVIGAHRIANGEAPYGHMPVQGNLKECGASDADGEVRDRIQTNGRCESSNPTGDTYGPVAYMAYLPGLAFFGWEGRWDELPAAHFTTIVFDLLAMIGLLLVGKRFGGARLAATLPFAWAAYPFTQYASNSNSNDAIAPALLIFGFWLAASPVGRGVFASLSSWVKFTSLLIVPLWASYPHALRRPRATAVFASAFGLVSLLVFWVLLLEPTPLDAARIFYNRTFASQFDRESPFSIWDWGQYHADGIPDLDALQKILIPVVVLFSLALFFVPRRKSPLQLAALTAAVLIAFELVLTHWFYLYLPWFLPFVAFAVLAPASRSAVPQRPRPDLRRLLRAVPGRAVVVVVVAALAVFLVSWALLHVGFYDRDQIRDTPVYQGYGDRILDGEMPYRDFRLEYPPGALPTFAVPSLFASEGDQSAYRRGFETLMWVSGAICLIGVILTLAALKASRRRSLAAVGFAALAPLALGSVVLSRFDLWPAALTALALGLLVSGRERVGLGVLGLGAATKLYPALLAPLAFMYLWRRRGRREALVGAAVFAAAVAVVIYPFAVLSPGGLWEVLDRQASRGLQIESLGSAVLLAAHHVGGLGIEMRASGGSQNLVGAAPDALAALHSIAQGLAVVAIWVAFAVGPVDRERLVRASALVVCAFVALGKVLSPQFLIWLIPLVPLVRGRRGLAASSLLALALVLTQLWFPYRYWDLALEFDQAASWLVLGRDLVLLALVGVLAWPAARRPVREEPRADASPLRAPTDTEPEPARS